MGKQPMPLMTEVLAHVRLQAKVRVTNFRVRCVALGAEGGRR